jgi:hypothetical protein
MTIIIKNTASDAVHRFLNEKINIKDKVAGKAQLDGNIEAVLSNEHALEIANSTKIQNGANGQAGTILGKVIELKARVMLEDNTEAREDLIYLNKSRQWGNVQNVQLGDIILPWSSEYKRGEVTIGADHSNSTPTQGFNEMNYGDAVTIKPITAAVELGFFELKKAARDGVDMIANEIRERQFDMDSFVESYFFQGLPQYSLPGYFSSLNPPKMMVAESVVNAGKFRWEQKTPSEILADLKNMREQAKVQSKNNVYPTVIQLSSPEYTLLSLIRMGDGTSPTILEQWTKEMMILSSPQLSFPQVATELMPLEFLNEKGIADVDGETGVAVTTRFGPGSYSLKYGNKQRTELQSDGWTYKMGLWAPFGGVIAKKDSAAIWFEGI